MGEGRGFGEACLILWGKDGQPVRKDKSILAKLVTVSAPSPGFKPCLASRFLAGSQVRGSPLGQANSANPLPTPPPPSPMPKAGSVQLPVPSNNSGARQHRQRGHGFLSSSWGQQLLLSCGAQGMPFPGSSSQGETQEQVVQIRNTSVRDCFKTRLFQASRRTNDVERSTQHHSVDEPCPPTFLPGGSQHIHFTLRARSCRWEPRVEGREGKRW